MMSSCNDAPSFRITVGPDIGVDEAMWNNTAWSCADWAGYECAIGGWGALRVLRRDVAARMLSILPRWWLPKPSSRNEGIRLWS